MLHSIDQSGDYPFLYAALVGDSNIKAWDRLTFFYNFAGYPAIFFDGGYRQFTSGLPTDADFRDRIEQSGARPTPSVGLITSIVWQGNGVAEISVRVCNNAPANEPPYAPTIPTGPPQAEPNLAIEFETGSYEPESDELYYQWDWDNGEFSGWIGPYSVGDPCLLSHTWTDTGAVEIRVQSKDSWGALSDWSAPKSVHISYGCCLLRGNTNGQSGIDVADLTFIVEYLFGGGPAPGCSEEGDVNASGSIDVADLTFLVEYLFGGGPPPPAC